MTNARVRPDLNGDFVLAILNVNEHEVTLNMRTRIENLVPSHNDQVCEVRSQEIDTPDPVNKVQYGKNLTSTQSKLRSFCCGKEAAIVCTKPEETEHYSSHQTFHRYRGRTTGLCKTEKNASHHHGKRNTRTQRRNVEE